MTVSLEYLKRTFKKNGLVLSKKGQSLKGKFPKIRCYVVVESSAKGSAIFTFDFTKKDGRTIKQWQDYLIKERKFEVVFIGKYLPAMNVKNNYDWRYRMLIGFTPLKK